MKLRFANIRFADSLRTLSALDGVRADGGLLFRSRFTALKHITVEGAALLLLGGCSNIELPLSASVQGTLAANPEIRLAYTREKDALIIGVSTGAFECPIELSPSPSEALITDMRNYFTCPLGLSVDGLSVAIGAINGGHLYPAKMREAIDLAVKGKFLYKHDGLQLDIPLRVPLKTLAMNVSVEPYWFRSAIVGVGKLQ